MRPFGWPRRSTVRAASNSSRSIPWPDNPETIWMQQNCLTTPRVLWPLAVVVIVLVGLAVRSFVHIPRAISSAPEQPGPPWIYGKGDARFTLVEYADLECPYCQAYFPIVRRWIDAN